MSWRQVRRWVIDQARSQGFRRAANSPPWLINAVEWSLARLGPWTPILRGTVADNMRRAGVYSGARRLAYFRQAALHVANGLRVLQRSSDRASFAELAKAQVHLDDSVDLLKSALAGKRGAVVAAPHVCNFLMTVARLGQEVPVSVYLRWSEDAVKRSWKEAWCRAAGVNVIIEPASAADPTSRAARCVDALREGVALVMTPDIAQKATKGVPVSVLGRRAFLPTGPVSIAMLAESPMVPVFGRLSGDIHTVVFNEPIHVRRLTRAEGGRKAAMAEAMAQWAASFERFLQEYPEAWFLWGDSRWTRVFKGDPKYTEVLPP